MSVFFHVELWREQESYRVIDRSSPAALATNMTQCVFVGFQIPTMVSVFFFRPGPDGGKVSDANASSRISLEPSAPRNC